MNTKALEYIPHDGRMALIDEIVEVKENFITCSIIPQQASDFRNKLNQIPSWIGLEYMAQTIGAYAGWLAKLENRDIKVGFLLGSRKLVLHTDIFKDETIYSQAELVFQNEELGSFKCTILGADKKTLLAEATVNVFQPEDIERFLEEKNQQ